jgi:hypothetical protein
MGVVYGVRVDVGSAQIRQFVTRIKNKMAKPLKGFDLPERNAVYGEVHRAGYL